MIRFLLTRRHKYPLQAVRKSGAGPKIELMTYDAIFRTRDVKRATYVFADLDRLGYSDLEVASRLYVQLKEAGLPVLNNPALVKKRYRLLRGLYEAGWNEFNVYLAEERPAAPRFPVFLRKQQGHAGPLSPLLHNIEEMDAAITQATSSGLPLENLMLIEYAAEPLADGIFRKLAAFKIGTAIIPHSSVHDTHWLVKEGKTGITPEKLYEEEAEMIRTNPFAEQMRKVFDFAGIEYGRADFGICQGRVQVYEINTNPQLYAPYTHPSAVRTQNLQLVWDKFLEGLRAIDTPAGGFVRLSNQDWKLNVQRRWRSILNHTRIVD
jgi:hypothetical protein